MKFVKDYKYKHIPFCFVCTKHTQFSVNTTSRITGAVSFENSEGPNPTFVNSRSDTNIHCNSCGKIMSRFEDRKDDFERNNEYDMQLYQDDELNKGEDWTGFIGLSLIALFPLGCTVATDDGSSSMEVFFLASIVWLIGMFVIACKDFLKGSNNVSAEKAKRKLRKYNRIIIGTSPNNEEVIFNQKTGDISYE